MFFILAGKVFRYFRDSNTYMVYLPVFLTCFAFRSVIFLSHPCLICQHGIIFGSRFGIMSSKIVYVPTYELHRKESEKFQFFPDISMFDKSH